MVTLVPDFALDDVNTELIFVVDRSGSMDGQFINQPKEGLQLFLRVYQLIVILTSWFWINLFNSFSKYSQET